MGSPPDQGPEPDRDPDPDRGPERRVRRDSDTEPIPRVSNGEAPGERAGPRDRFVGSASVGDYPPPDIDAEELAGLGDATGVPLGARRVLPLEDEPSGLVSRYLFPTERYRGEWKRHWIHLLPQVAVGTLATFALGYLTGFVAKRNAEGLTTVGVLIWVGIMGWVAWRVADWYYDRFILTNKRVMVVAGIIARRVAMMPLLRVTDMKYEQSPLGRMLNYGTFVLESAGQEQALREVKHLPNPNELYLRVVEEMYEPQAVEARLGRTAEEVKADDGA
jgi:membrane protein YdbS with pleckstrin-like domain